MAQDPIARLQAHLDNPLDPVVGDRPMVAGIIGDHPSRYAKSPPIWTAAFRDLGMDAAYVPLDVTAEHLPALLQALREWPAYVGGNVTVPHKVAVVGLLDDVDPLARQVGAVNTICRTQEGRLVGYNTDGEGAVEALTRAVPGQESPLLPRGIRGKRVLLIGAGGAGRAVAFAMAHHLGTSGSLAIVNRSLRRAEELAEQVAAVHGNAQAVDERDLVQTLREADLVVNASTRGQSGMLRLPGERVTCLEPYSCLAPADPAVFDAAQHASEADFYRDFSAASAEDIRANLEASARAISEDGLETAFYDLIYSPPETVFLAQARERGHRTLNGRGMNLLQAVEAFVARVMAPHLERHGWARNTAYERVLSAMAAAW